MSTDRAQKAYEYWLEATHKRDYFVAGVAMALIGYLANTFHPGRIGWNARTLELVALLSILGAAFSALKRIEAVVATLRVRHERIRSQETTDSLIAAAGTGARGGEVLLAATAIKSTQSDAGAAASIKAEWKKWKARAERWHSARNYLLMSGLTLLMAARVLEAYGK